MVFGRVGGGVLGGRWVGGLVWAGVLGGWPLVARAEERVEVAYSGSVGALYGGLPDATDSVNPYGAGLGLRLGLTLPQRTYVGVSYEHFFGDSVSTFADGGASHTAATTEQLQGWMGYEFQRGGVVALPCFGAGAAYRTDETLIANARGWERTGDDALGVVVSAALLVLVPIGPVSLLLEARYAIGPEDVVAGGQAMVAGAGFGAEL